jgi:hypothetical protein
MNAGLVLLWGSAVGCVSVLYLAPQLALIATLARVLHAVAPENRRMAPRAAWLNIVPGFEVFWRFATVDRVADSLRREFERRGWETAHEGFARTTGGLYAVGGLVGLAMVVGRFAAEAAGAWSVVVVLEYSWLGFGFPSFVGWLLYWLQLNRYQHRLTRTVRGYRVGSLQEDYDDEFRPRPREDDLRFPGDDRPEWREEPARP